MYFSLPLAEDKITEEKPSEIPIKIWLLNEKEALERILKETGRDMVREDVDTFIQMIENDKQQIYARRRDIKGVGMVYAHGLKFADLLAEAVHAHMLGMYNSAISLSCIAAERFCYDFIDIATITINSRGLDNEAKTYLYHIPLSKLIMLFKELNVIDKEARDLLFKINDKRNRYLHPTMESQDLEKDSLHVLNLMCALAKHRLSVLNFYDVVDGKLVLKPQYRN